MPGFYTRSTIPKNRNGGDGLAKKGGIRILRKNLNVMRKIALVLFAALASLQAFAYNDHRGHNVDSLEQVVAGWTTERIMQAGFEESRDLVRSFYELSFAYRNINGERSQYFARKVYLLARRWNWLRKMSDGLEGIGLIYYGKAQFDSALFYYNRALEVIDRMAAGEFPPHNERPYERSSIDDCYSSLYGAIGNTYNMMGDIPTAMEYYQKAGEIFERNGWNESSSVLWYNLGETWFEEGDIDKALESYEKSEAFGRAAQDTLLIAQAWMGLGKVYLEKGDTQKALERLMEAEKYFSQHRDQEFVNRMDTLELIGQALSQQKDLWRKTAISGGLVIVLLLFIVFVLWRMHRLRRQKEGADIVIEDALGETEHKAEDPFLTDREEQILPLIAAGYTSPQIADKICLSLPTIKWYRKKLLTKFEAANTAELISKAKERGLI